MNEKSKLQETLYQFPYHYLPQVGSDNSFSRYRALRWGFAYLCYLLHIAEFIEQEHLPSLLDVGCGDGRLISMLTGLPECRLTGIDINARAISMAQALNPGQQFVCGDVALLDKSFDLVSCIEVLEHIPDHQVSHFITGMLARVKPGGQLLVGVPTLNKPISAKHFRHYDEKILLQQLSPENHGFTVESRQYIFKGDNRLYRLYVRLTDNRLWFIGIKLFEKLMWRYVWHKLRRADAASGHHLMMCLRKTR